MMRRESNALPPTAGWTSCLLQAPTFSSSHLGTGILGAGRPRMGQSDCDVSRPLTVY